MLKSATYPEFLAYLQYDRIVSLLRVKKKSLEREKTIWSSRMAKHHPDLIFCRKQAGVAIGRLCEKCDGRCVICDSYVRPSTLVRICDECNYGSYQGRCVICGGPGCSDAYYCRECTIMEKDRDGCPKIIMAQKRKRVTFEDSEDHGNARKVAANDDNKKTSDSATGKRLYDGKYTLDSDEEDDEQPNGKQMNQDDLDEIGQEGATIDFDEEIKITPFNIDEEMDEGHYDADGCFQWKKRDKEEVRDAWLDNIDWSNVNEYKFDGKNSTKTQQSSSEQQKDEDVKLRNDGDEVNNDDDIKFNEVKVIQSMLNIMQPGESVVQAIKRLGAASSNKSKQRFRQKKTSDLPKALQTPAQQEPQPDELRKNKLLLEELTGLADQFVSDGQPDIYQETFERLKMKFDRSTINNVTTTSSNNPSFDMYGDGDPTSLAASSTDSSSANNDNAATVMWEYKFENTSHAKIHGPFSSEQMVRQTNMGKFDEHKNSVWCRRVGTEQFYGLQRIDFDLYID
ncbi:unnamed protein product [Didymodactylos carnosus]|uniref:GYF domain-containing protein n=1 Tax=Didymodactylos carnosus TaxID=1234261 RepID=A0A814FDM3_9BILA|nr:unnamed protein product [Didymodactylos carnosus]CAF1011395.1 unnamed protein product [Didymodactylos carnosus]CAF3754097.1 unnamed protein product [Didymodactylos carnosus]CAF3780302.1 unnamed protein product [Didymodactylos carnosus]